MTKINIVFSAFLFVATFFITNCTKEDAPIVDEIIEEEVIEDDNFVWKNWYLSVPIDRGDGSEKATSINYDEIINDKLSSAEKEYFYKLCWSGSLSSNRRRIFKIKLCY